MSKGFVYILSNPCMPGIVKVGKTTRTAELRASELFQTGVPTPFAVEHVVYSPDCGALEAEIHSLMPDLRISRGREFFKAELAAVIELLDDAHRCQVQEFLDEFLPDHAPALPDLILNEKFLFDTCCEMQAHPFEVVSAIGFLTADEIAPGMARWAEWVESRRAEISKIRGRN